MIKNVTWIVLFIFFLTSCNDNKSGLETPTVRQQTLRTSEATVHDGGNPVTIRFAVYNWQQAQYRELVQAFEEYNPEITIELVSIPEVLELANNTQEWPEDARVRLAAEVDVLPVSVGQGTLEQGFMLDLQPLLAADNSIIRDDFYPNLLEQYEWDGALWALPIAAEFTLIFYDKNAFNEAGLDYPQLDWTWNDFLATAQHLTVRQEDEVMQWGFIQRIPNALEMIQAQAGPLFSTGDSSTMRSLQNPEIVDALRWYSELFLTHKVTPYLPNSDLLSPYNLIANGAVAMWTDRSTSWAWRNQDKDIGVIPFPITSPNNHSTPIYSEALFISAGSQQPQAAWRWLSFLSRQALAAELATAPSEIVNVPARRSVAEASAFWEKVDPELATALKYALDHSYPPIFVTDIVFQEAMAEMVEEGKSIEEVLATAELALEQSLAEIAATRTETMPSVVISNSGQVQDSTTGDLTTIVFTTISGPGSLSGYRDLAQLFEENHPGIVVEVQEPDISSGEISTQEIAAYSDCFRWYPVFNEESRAAILPIEPMLTIDTTLNEDEFFPAIVEQFTYQGQLWGLPSEMAINVIEYDKTLFDVSGVDYPALDWTTEDFLAIAIALTEGDREDMLYGFVPNVAEGSDIINMLNRMGAQLLDESVDPPRITLDHPSVVYGMRWYTSLVEFGVKPILAADLDERNSMELWQQRQQLIDGGRAAMWSGNIGNVSLGQNINDNVGVVPLPLSSELNEAGAGDRFSLGYFISAHTQAQQECWEWIKFISGQASVVDFGLPARRSVAESEAFRQLVGIERAATYLAALQSATQSSHYERLSGQYEWLRISYVWIYQAYDQIVHKGVTVEEALDLVQAKADAYYNCMTNHEAHLRANEIVYKTCLREADDSLPDFFYDINE